MDPRHAKEKTIPRAVRHIQIRTRGRSVIVVLLIAMVAMAMTLTFEVVQSRRRDVRALHLSSEPHAQQLRYAYVFYASNDAYCCAAIVNMARLRRFKDPHTLPESVDLVLIVSEGVSEGMQRVAQEQWGALVYKRGDFGPEQAMAGPLGKFGQYYKDCFQKFLAFLLPVSVYKRLIVLDADCLILRPPHHLFGLPDEIPLAAPPAYWYWNRPNYQDTAFWQQENLRQSRQDFLTTWIMSVSDAKHEQYGPTVLSPHDVQVCDSHT